MITLACSVGGKPVHSIISVDAQGITIKTMDRSGQVLDFTGAPDISAEQQDWTITIKGMAFRGKRNLPWQNWRPARGRLSACLLHHQQLAHGQVLCRPRPNRAQHPAGCGVLDTARAITFRSDDGYEMSFTREQLLDTPHYYYPRVKEGSPEGAQPVEPVIAYEYKEGSADMGAAAADAPCLIIGQRNLLEHTNPLLWSM
jgi:hypothetical protein